MRKPVYAAIAFLIIAVAVFLRVVLLDLKPPHFDEGINGFFVDQMIKQGFYKYDPSNYHGPLHFYLLHFLTQILGRSIIVLRIPSVMAGVASVFLILTVWRRVLTDRVSLLFAAFVAISPASVFVSRYAIHESEMNLFLLATCLGIALLYRHGDRMGLWFAGMGLTGMVLTKETYIVHLACLLLAVPVLLLFECFQPSTGPGPARKKWNDFDLMLVITTALTLIVFFYSGTFLNPNGINGLWMTFAEWFKTGTKQSGHEKLPNYWLVLLATYEWAGLLGFAACVRYIFRSDRVVRYFAIAGAGTFVAFSLIPYKTPWSILPMLWPLFLALADLCIFLRRRWRTALIYLVPAVAIGHAAWATWRVNFVDYENPDEKYVYVQTYRELDQFTGPLLSAAREDPRLYHVKGAVLLDSQFPIPWVLGDFTHVGFYSNRSKPDCTDADFVIADQERIEATEKLLEGNYYTGEVRVRDGMKPARYYLRAEIYAPWCNGKTLRVFGWAAIDPQ